MIQMNSPIPLVIIVAGSITLGMLLGGDKSIVTPIASNNTSTELVQPKVRPKARPKARQALPSDYDCKIVSGSDGLYYPLYANGEPYSFGETSKSEAYASCRSYKKYVSELKTRTYEEVN